MTLKVKIIKVDDQFGRVLHLLMNENTMSVKGKPNKIHEEKISHN